MAMSQVRLLVTGSRNYTDRQKVERALHPWAMLSARFTGGIELVHGKCPLGGLDLIAEGFWAGWGLPVRAVPAENVRGRFLGPERNLKMVALGGYLACLGFPLSISNGTRDCMRKAAAAGILTLEVK